MPLAAMRAGSSHSRIAKVWPPRMSAEATPSTVDISGCTTRVRKSEIPALDRSALEKPTYMTAVVWPVDFRMIGSCAWFGIRYLTCCTFAMTSVIAWLGS